MLKRLIVGLVLTIVLVTACGSGDSNDGTRAGAGSTPRPSSPARLTIVTPQNGAVVKGPDVPMKLELDGGKVVQPMGNMSGMEIDPREGHIHITVDGQLISMNYGLHEPLKNLSAGTHTLRAEFVATDHMPFDPPVFQEIAFTVKR
ncbi:MAG: DUF4399 domain-containing protein [Actinomycetota bacterium]|nr:DUF4399 domain-containing protein [Actinomycetota bacterium]